MSANTCTAPRHTGGSARVGSLCQGLAPHVATPLISLDIWSESFVSDVTTLCSQIVRLRNTRTTRIESKPAKQNTVWDWYYNSFDLEPEPTSIPASVWLMLIIHFWDADFFFYCATNINRNECWTSVGIFYCDGVNTYRRERFNPPYVIGPIETYFTSIRVWKDGKKRMRWSGSRPNWSY